MAYYSAAAGRSAAEAAEVRYSWRPGAFRGDAEDSQEFSAVPPPNRRGRSAAFIFSKYRPAANPGLDRDAAVERWYRSDQRSVWRDRRAVQFVWQSAVFCRRWTQELAI